MNQRITIIGSAICCPELQVLQAFALQGVEVDKQLLPASLRRRNSLTTRMAVTAGVRACEQAAVEASVLPSIFASVGGEIQVTDALCRTLPDVDALLSPTQFHNSVHNTTAGYWGIINQCRQTATAIAAVDDTFAMGLLEAWSQLQQCPGDLLLVCYDEMWPQYLAPPMGTTPFACALVLSNQTTGGFENSISLPIQKQPDAQINQDLYHFIQGSPAASVIPLMQALQGSATAIDVPLNINSTRWSTHLQKTRT